MKPTNKVLPNSEIDEIVRGYWDEALEYASSGAIKDKFFPALRAYQEFVDARRRDLQPSERCMSSLEFHLEKVLELDINSEAGRKQIPAAMGLVPSRMKVPDIALKRTISRAVDRIRYRAGGIQSLTDAADLVKESLIRTGITRSIESQTVERYATKYRFDDSMPEDS
jgi:hypothetical protein